MISREEWLQAVAEATDATLNDPDAITTAELATALNCSVPTARRRAALLVRQGKAVTATKVVMRHGRGPQRMPAYRLLTNKTEEKGTR